MPAESAAEQARGMPEERKVPSPDEVLQARTPAGGWTRQQLAEWGVPWPPPKGWRRDLEERYAEAHPD